MLAKSDGVSYLKVRCGGRTLTDLQCEKSEVVPQRFALAPQISRLAVSIRLPTPQVTCFSSHTCEPYAGKGKFMT